MDSLDLEKQRFKNKKRKLRRQRMKQVTREIKEVLNGMIHKVDLNDARREMIEQKQKICSSGWNGGGDCYGETFCVAVNKERHEKHVDYKCRDCGHLLCGCCMDYGMIFYSTHNSWDRMYGCPVCKFQTGDYLSSNMI
jgi:hypothetical protein